MREQIDSGACVIHASAGTGKTHRLGQRYLQLLLAGVEPDRILATTFTRKAAGEIQSRVLGKLADAALGDPEALRFIPGLTPQSAGRMLTRATSSLHRIGIGTLDSFFLRVAGAFTLELGMPPGWTILDNHDDAALQHDAIRDLLNDSPPQRIIDLIRLLNSGQPRRGVYSQIAEVVSRFYNLYREQPAESAWCWLQPPSISGPPPTEHWAALMQQYERSGVVPRNKNGSQSMPWVNAIHGNLEKARAKNWQAFLGAGIAKKIIYGDGSFNGKEIPIQVIEAYQPMLAYASAALLNKVAGNTRAAFELLKAFHLRYQRLKISRRRFRFDDVTRLLVDALPTGRLDDIYYRLDGRIDHMLLDELQDTSLHQWRVLQPIAGELAATESRSLLCVGDEKQAIYGWRGGVAEIFATLDKCFPGIRREELTETHRCRPAIVQTVNSLGGGLLNNPATTELRRAVTEWSRGFREHFPANREVEGYAQLRVARAAHPGASQSESTLAEAATLVHDLRKQTPGRTIGVLVRTNDAVARVILELRKLQVPASEEGGNPLDDSPGVSLVLSLLHLADHPGDTAAAFHVASSPLAAHLDLATHTDAPRVSRVATSVRRALASDGYGPTIERWTRWLAPSCDERSLRRLTQLVEMAHRYEPQMSLRPSDFVRRVREERVEDPAAADVRVMTVHKAKGLGFDIVVLPDLDQRLAEVHRGASLTDRPGRTEAPSRITRYVNEETRALDDNLARMYEQAVTTEAMEDLCILYVMLTRAVYALHMLIAPSRLDPKGVEKTFQRTFAGILRGALVDDQPVLPGKVIYEKGNPQWNRSETLKPMKPRAHHAMPEPVSPAPSLLPTARTRLLPRSTPSGSRGFTSFSECVDFTSTSQAGRKTGMRVHELLEQVEWLDTGTPPHVELSRYFRGGSIRRLLTRANYPSDADVTVFREHPFLVRIGDGLLRGNIDRLVLLRRNGTIRSAQVIDFKTDAVDPSRLTDRVNAYRPQMDAYRSAVACTYRLNENAVTATLAFLSIDKVVDL